MTKLIKFIFVGAINTILCIFLFLVFNNFFKFNIFVSNLLAYLVIIPLSYILYRTYVFKPELISQNKARYLLCFVLAYLLNYFIVLCNSTYTSLSNEVIHFTGMIGYTLFFYYLNNRFVFTPKA